MSHSADTIYAVIVNYNSGAQDLLRAVRSVYTSQTSIAHTVVVDNASRDGSLEACRAEFPRVHYICNTHNIGFAPAANSGMRYSLERGAQKILLLNPDAYIESQTISALIGASKKHKKEGIISPVIKKPQTKDVWFAAGCISWWRFRAFHDKAVKKTVTGSVQDIYSTEYVSGCVMLINKEVCAKTGLFDERFFLYYEDADLCLRARKDGFFIGVVPGSIAWHYEKSEAQKAHKTYWLVRSGLIFFSRHTPLTLRWWFHTHHTLRRIKNKILRLWGGDNAQHSAVAQAYHDYTYDIDTTT